MEIPSAYNYETNEQEKSIDFLDKKRNLSFYFDEEAAASLPEVSQEDIETGQEKYCLLLGNTQPNEKDENTSVEIKCVLQSEDNEIKFYEEGREYVDINLTTAQKVVKALQDGYPEYKNCELVGEVHTHPVDMGDSKETRNPCLPSKGDFESIIQEYENGVLSSKKPFIFGIGGKDGENTVYKFYRIIKDKENKYGIEEIKVA